jgi:hypothetical protein
MWTGPDESSVVDYGSWQELSPWEATYWKTLPEGYCVEFVVRRRKSIPCEEYDHSEMLRHSKELTEFLKWYRDQPFLSAA